MSNGDTTGAMLGRKLTAHSGVKEAPEYMALSTGMGTTPCMWEMASECLVGAMLPEPLNRAIYSLRDGKAELVEKS